MRTKHLKASLQRYHRRTMCCQTQRAVRSMTCAAASRFQALSMSEVWIQYMKHYGGTPRRGTRGHGLPSGTLKMSGTMAASGDETEIAWPHMPF